jgi:hypothetical protein
MSEGYLYCFSNESMPGILKIGMTERTPELRLNEANGSDTWKPPTPYKIEFAKKVLNPKQQETMLHKLLEQYTERVNPKREFFRISVEKARKFFDLIDDYIEEDDFEEEFEDINDEELTIEDGDSFTTGEQSNLKMEEKYCRFFCKKCNYQTSYKHHYKRHLQTPKHQTNKDNIKREHSCICGKSYNFRQGLHKHKKMCNYIKQDNSDNVNLLTNVLIEVVKHNIELSNQNLELTNKFLKRI